MSKQSISRRPLVKSAATLAGGAALRALDRGGEGRGAGGKEPHPSASTRKRASAADRPSRGR